MDDEWITWKVIWLVDVVTWLVVDVWQRRAGLCFGRMAAVAAIFLFRLKKNQKIKKQK